MKVMVGLGNPGKKYEGTRHNVGWQVLAEMAVRHGASRPKLKFDAELSEVVVAGDVIVVVDAEAELDHAVNAACELSGLVEVEAGGEQRGVEQEPNQVLHGLV